MPGRQILFGLVAGALLAAGCSRSPQAGPRPQLEGKVRVVVSIPPQTYFVERVGGARVSVEALVQPGREPHSYEPTPKQVAELSRAHVYFRIGFPFEDTLVRKISAAHRNLSIVDTRQGITLRRMTRAHEHEGEGGHHGEEAGGPDPHIWLDPLLVKVQAGTIARELGRIDSAHAAEYAANLGAFEADLDALHARIAELLAPLKGRRFYVFHPAFGYFADRYGLEEKPVEIEGKEPSAKQIAELIEAARKDGVRVIFVQAEFPRATAEKVAKAIGGVVVPMTPLAPDCLANLGDMAAKVRQALAPGGPEPGAGLRRETP